MAIVKRLFRNKILDLKPLLLNSTADIKISIFVSNLHRLDNTFHKYFKQVQWWWTYKVVKFLRDEGKLPEIMLGNYVS